MSSGISTVLDPPAQGREELFLEAADRKHTSAQRHLTGHRNIGPDRKARESVDTIEVTMPIPALGPSLGTAPSGR